jgi:PEGA domain/Family of unknown function (DUF5683)
MKMRNMKLVLGLLLCSAVAVADPLPMGGVVITTNPPGGQVTLTGEVTVSGVSPAHFSQLMIGSYEVTVRLFGYEDYHTRVTIDPSKEVTVDVKLSKKSRFKSGLRSAIIPGWGQRYVEHNKKGLFFTVLVAGTAAVYLKADNDFDDKRQTYNELVNTYKTATSVSEQKRLAVLIASAQASAYDAEENRHIAIGAVAIAWGINVLDAVIFFPENRGTYSVKSFSYAPQSDGVTLGLSFTRMF